MLFRSDDPKLLNEFDEIARVVQEQLAAGPSEPTVVYLKYIPALAAEELIRNVLNGTTAGGGGGGGGGLLGEVASSVLGGGGFLGSLLGMGGGGGGATSTSKMSGSGDISITADPRLNALWVQANPLDMQLIEELIEIIDTPSSPIDVQTRGTPNIIYLENAPVADVEATVRSVFADRLGGGGGQQNAQRPPSPQEFIEALRGGGGGGGGRRGSAPKELKESTMTLTSDKKNNALIVVAPKQLFEEVEELVKMLDRTAEGSEDSVIVAPIGGINPTTVKSALSSVFGSQARTSTTSNPQTSAPSNPNPAPNFGGFNPGAFGGQGGFRGFQMAIPNAGGGGGNPGGGGFQFPGGFGGMGGGGQGNRGMGGMGGMGGGMGQGMRGMGGMGGGGGNGGGNRGGGRVRGN